MPAQTQLSKTVINAYNVAHYHVKVPDNAFVLLIKKKSGPLAALMKDLGVSSAAYVTSHNPYGRKTNPNANERSHKALRNDIEKMGLVFYEGAGEDPSGNWKSERSFLVLGIPREAAEELAKKHRQNALVWVDSDAVPQLILLR